MKFWGMMGNTWTSLETPLLDVISLVSTIIVSLIGLGVLCVAVYLAFKMVTAVDDTKRKDAKKQLIYALVGLAGVVILLVLWHTVVLDAIKDAMDTTKIE